MHGIIMEDCHNLQLYCIDRNTTQKVDHKIKLFAEILTDMGGNGGSIGEGIRKNRHTPRWGRFVGEIYAFGGIWNSDSVA
jgi:hypothetical protein